MIDTSCGCYDRSIHEIIPYPDAGIFTVFACYCDCECHYDGPEYDDEYEDADEYDEITG